MSQEMDSLTVYRELAERYDQLGQVSMRDRFLMLAAAAALETGMPSEAERLRLRLLQQNRHHMLRPYRSFEEASRAPDVRTYLHDLKENYPLDLAAQLLESLQGGQEPPIISSPLRHTESPSAPSPSFPRRGDATPVPAPIPMTAPLLDPFSRQEDAGTPAREPPRPAWEPIIPYHIADEVEPAPVVPRAPLAPEPRRPMTDPAVPTYRPSGSKPSSPPVDDSANVGWLSLTLATVAALTAVALAAFTLARPFVPVGWLP